MRDRNIKCDGTYLAYIPHGCENGRADLEEISAGSLVFIGRLSADKVIFFGTKCGACTKMPPFLYSQFPRSDRKIEDRSATTFSDGMIVSIARHHILDPTPPYTV